MAVDIARHGGARSSVALGCTKVENAVVTFPHPPPAMRAALDALKAADADLGRIEAAAGPLPWRRRQAGFAGLLHAIVAQQISVQSAAAIWARLAAVAGSQEPASLLALSDDTLLGAGLSRPKVAHARALAVAFLDGTLDADALARMEDEAAIERIVSVRGLGRWSAEVYLLFALARADVFPRGDVALAAAVAHLKGLDARPGPAALLAIAEPWRPWRGLAARLLFHHWRHATGRPALEAAPSSSPAVHGS